MENEIELKVMLAPENIPTIVSWLEQQTVLAHKQIVLGNTYYDTQDQFFAQQQMGLRVRNKNNQYELTLKTKGEIVGGLHIRPEYNLPLENDMPDFKRLVSHFNLQFADVAQIQQDLLATFSTDFKRDNWLIQFNKSEIEIAIDQGEIQNQYGKESICEIELELKKGDLKTLIQCLNSIPQKNGMWLSGLSKAQRGYLVGNSAKQQAEITALLQTETHNFSPAEHYQFEQQLADFIRMTENSDLVARFKTDYAKQIDDVIQYVQSKEYLAENVRKIEKYFGG